MSCSRCGTRTNLWCLGCERVQYCGTKCQGSDWSRHASTCGDRLIGAGSEGDDFIPFKEELFWRKLAEKKLTFEQFLRSIIRRQNRVLIRSSVRRVFDPMEMERVRDIFGITREEMELQAKTVAVEADSGAMFRAIIENGVPLTSGDVAIVVSQGRVDILAYILGIRSQDFDEWFFPLIGIAAKYDQEEALRLLLADPRFQQLPDKTVVLKQGIENGYGLLVRVLLEDPLVRARFSKDDARRALEDTSKSVRQVLKAYIQA